MCVYKRPTYLATLKSCDTTKQCLWMRIYIMIIDPNIYKILTLYIYNPKICKFIYINNSNTHTHILYNFSSNTDAYIYIYIYIILYIYIYIYNKWIDNSRTLINNSNIIYIIFLTHAHIYT